MADNFNMKQFLAENKLGAYSRLKEEKFYAPNYVAKKYGSKAKEIEDSIQDEEDNNPNIWDLYTSLQTPEETDDFVKGFMNEGPLNEREVIYVVRDGKCYRKDDEGNMDEVNMSYCKRFAEGKEKEEEGYMGTQYDSSEDMAVDMVKKGLPEEKVEEVNQGNLMAVERIEEIVNNLARNIATNSNIPTQEKLGLVQALKELKDLVDDLGANIEQEEEDEYVSDYSRRRASELKEILSPEAYDRMDGLVNRNHLLSLISSTQDIIGDLKAEGFEEDEIFDFIVSKIKTLG